jgi:hypothetical protein
MFSCITPSGTTLGGVYTEEESPSVNTPPRPATLSLEDVALYSMVKLCLG